MKFAFILILAMLFTSLPSFAQEETKKMIISKKDSKFWLSHRKRMEHSPKFFQAEARKSNLFVMRLSLRNKPHLGERKVQLKDITSYLRIIIEKRC